MPGPSVGDLAFRSGDFDAAGSAYAAAAAANADDANAALGLGTIDLYRNDLDAARTYLSRAATLDPPNPRVQNRLKILAGRVPNAVDYQIAMPSERVDSLGSFTVSNVPGLYFPDGDQFKIFPFDVAGTISHLYFRRTELTFDFDAMRLIVSRPSPPNHTAAR